MGPSKRHNTKAYLSSLASSLPSRSRIKNRNKSVVENTYQGDCEEENIYFQCLSHSFLPSNHKRLFRDVYSKINNNGDFAWKCLHLAIHSRNEDIVKAILNEIDVDRESFSKANENVYDRVVEEAVNLDDLETIISVLEWRNDLAGDMKLSHVDLKLTRYQKRAMTLMVTACIRNNFAVVQVLYNDGYRVHSKPYSNPVSYTHLTLPTNREV